MSLKRIFLICFLTIYSPLSFAGDYDEIIHDHVMGHVLPFISQTLIIEEIEKQNARYADFTLADIQRLDKTWVNELQTEQYDLITQTLLSPVSLKLYEYKQSIDKNLICEMIVMDDKGMNVGQLSPSSDYWQGDEDKWNIPFNEKPNELYIGPAVSFDNSSQCYVVQASIAIHQPETGEEIGVVMISYNAEQLEIEKDLGRQ